ncbi:MAG TPA: DUF2177 domain-containing protein, partial [Verrucomicrobia bacterium]|nr:DUF2177 domain-containing protein [Verrucomicrobiota bacterium]
LWLGLVAKAFYQSRMATVVNMEVNWPVAGLFYALHVIGIMFFVTVPAVQVGLPLPSVLWRGALYGFFTYATYDLTNLATVRGWPASVALVDMAWGAFLNAVVSVASVLIIARTQSGLGWGR